MSEPQHPSDDDRLLEGKVRGIVHAIEEERYACDMTGLEPSVIEAMILHLRPDGKIGHGQKLMLRILHRYGAEGMEHGRAELEQFVSRLLRVMDEETDLDPSRDFTPLQQHFFRKGDALEMTRRRFWSVLTGACGAGFLASGTIDLLAGPEPHRNVPPASDNPWQRRIEAVREEKNKLVSPPVEIGIGAVILNDAHKEWTRAKVEFMTEKLRQVATAVDQLAVEVDRVGEQGAGR